MQYEELILSFSFHPILHRFHIQVHTYVALFTSLSAPRSHFPGLQGPSQSEGIYIIDDSFIAGHHCIASEVGSEMIQ